MTGPPPTKRRVLLESPFAGSVALYLDYAREAMNNSLSRGEAPLASHLLYPAVLDDDIPDERQLSIDASHAWMDAAEAVVFYTDLGMSRGMSAARKRADEMGKPCEERSIKPRVAYRGIKDFDHR